MSNSLIFKTVYISQKKHFNKQKLLYILNENTIWPSGVIVRESDSHEKNTMCVWLSQITFRLDLLTGPPLNCEILCSYRPFQIHKILPSPNKFSQRW